ncbi:MAG: hypothetical protein JST54_23705 [Deltaproteobacteria bacterium]|nr:hypothetical protein [Deltaproteobacteria bacterium]
MSSRLKDFARLGATLRRVRVADRPLEGGGKKVWHQGEHGAEVISFVDSDGHVTRQEAYVGGDAVVWEHQRPLTTGTMRIEGSAGDTLAPDASVRVPSVLNAVSMLEGYSGEDKYLRHLRAVLAIAAQQLPVAGLDAADAAALRRVTADQPVVTPGELAAFQGRQKSVLPWVVVAVLVAVLLAVLLLRH